MVCFEGVSFDDDVDMEVELSMSAEEQLQSSLDSLRDAVINWHRDTQQNATAGHRMFYYLKT